MGVYDSLDKYTQTALLQTALNAARDDVDKREGSIMYDALAPLAFLAGKLIEVFKSVAENADIQTAQGDALDWAASQFGIYRTEAVAAVREAQATPQDIEFAVGDTFKTDAGLGLVWECTEVLTGGRIVVQCKTAGADGGADYGELTPQGNTDGLQSLVFADTRNAGKDEETDADFRIRFWKELQRESYGGNFADYQRWLFSEFAQQPNGAAIKGASIFPVWNGGGTIKIIPYIETDESAIDAPTADLIVALKNYLDPEPLDGKGAGVAPIGHAVTVEAPTFEAWTKGAGVAPIGHAVTVEAPTFEAWTIEAVVRTRAGETEITEEDAAAAAAEVKAAIEAEMLESITRAESAYPTTAAYTFEFTRAMFINAIMGDNITPRFLDVEEVRVNGEIFTGAQYTQTAEDHVMPKFESLTLTRSSTP